MRLVAWPLLLLGCSTVAESTPRRLCETDEDCDEGQACFNFVCQESGEEPPLTQLGFDIEERGVVPPIRYEVAGFDVEIDANPSQGDVDVVLDRDLLTQNFRLSAVRRTREEERIAATFELAQPSRFARSPVLTSRRVMTTMESEMVSATDVAWPWLHPDNAALDELAGVTPAPAREFVLWTTYPLAPAPESTAPASLLQWFDPPAVPEEPIPCEDDLDCAPEGTAAAMLGACIQSLPGLTGTCRRDLDPPLSYTATYDTSCDRSLTSRIVRLDDPSVGVSDATVSVRYADVQLDITNPPLSIPPRGERPGPICRNDNDCIAGEQRCAAEDPEPRCELRLQGRRAGTATSDMEGRFQARVYMYCEGEPGTFRRGFAASVIPDAASALPAMEFAFEGHAIPETNPNTNPTADVRMPPCVGNCDLCLPSWGPPTDQVVEVRGPSANLWEAYRCCDVSCLPADAEAAAAGPPAAREVCAASASAGLPTLRFHAELEMTEALADTYAVAEHCVPPLVRPVEARSPNGETTVRSVVGTLSRTAGECTTTVEGGLSCVARNLAPGLPDAPARYRVWVESPTGSVLQSAEVWHTLGEPLVVDLPPRRLLRGRVRLGCCDPATQPDQDCTSVSAVVMAERVAPGNDARPETIPGPHFHTVPTFYDPDDDRDGAFVLPLDPGDYVLTALPSGGTTGGPAPILRLQVPEEGPLRIRRFSDPSWTDVEDGPDAAGVELVLEPGVFVRMDMRGFDARTQVIPLDLGSWKPIVGSDLPTRRDPDLNNPSACYGDGGNTGCRIRRLTESASLPLSQENQLRFTARALGGQGATCP